MIDGMCQTLLRCLLPLLLIAGNVRVCRADAPVAGLVTFTTSRSTYVSIEGMRLPAPGDSILTGLSPDSLAPTLVKAVSGSRVVLERTSPLAIVETGGTVFLALSPAVPSTRAAGTPRSGQTATPRSGDLETTPAAWGVSGRVAAQYYRYEGDGGFSYDQPSAFVDLRLAKSAGIPLSLNMRLRTRLIRDLAAPGGGNLRTERRDRLYDLSLEYGRAGDPWYISLGRMRTIARGGMGGLDGLVIERALGAHFRAGVFGGIAPELDNFIGDRTATKRGAHLTWSGAGKNGRIDELTLALIAESNPGSPTVTLLYLDHTLARGPKLFLTQEAAVNLTPSGDGPESKPLQNIRSSLSWTPVSYLRAGASYAGYLAQEYRTLDTFIDPAEAIRYSLAHTLTPSVELLLPHHLALGAETLLGDDPAVSYGIRSASLRFRASAIADSRTSAGLSLVLTDQSRITGAHLLLTASTLLGAGTSLTLTAGAADYISPHRPSYRDYTLRLAGYQSIGRRFSCSVYALRSWGDSPASTQGFIEASFRLPSPRR